jgi:hypothetical protein
MQQMMQIYVLNAVKCSKPIQFTDLVAILFALCGALC